MKKTNIHKLVFAAVLVALAVVGSLVSFPIGASKCAPVQHLVNIIGASRRPSGLRKTSE